MADFNTAVRAETQIENSAKLTKQQTISVLIRLGFITCKDDYSEMLFDLIG